MNRKPARPITDGDVATYLEDGVVCLRGLFDQEWCTRMHDAAIRYMDSGSGRARVVDRPDETGKFYSNVFMCGNDPDFLAFRDQSPAAQIGAALMGCAQVRFWYDQLFIKEPATVAPTHWHHDLPFWPFLGEHLVSIWLALTPVTKQSSGLEYVKGSHRWGKFYRPVTPDEDPAFANPALEPCPNFSGTRKRSIAFVAELGFATWRLHLPSSARRSRCRAEPISNPTPGRFVDPLFW